MAIMSQSIGHAMTGVLSVAQTNAATKKKERKKERKNSLHAPPTLLHHDSF
jgi:hypothetical protein